jgi:hypothetical protein
VKEISLQDLLNLADASAHDGICDFWNQKPIHYLVVYTSTQEDFEIIGVGPTLPCASLEDIGSHLIPGKKPEFYVKCPAAVAKRLAPKLAPAAHPTAVPSMKGRTSGPFTRPEPKSSTPPPPAPTASSPAPAPTAKPVSFNPAASPLTDEQRDLLKNYAARLAELDAREKALSEREAALQARAADLDRREEQLKLPAS